MPRLRRRHPSPRRWIVLGNMGAGPAFRGERGGGLTIDARSALASRSPRPNWPGRRPRIKAALPARIHRGACCARDMDRANAWPRERPRFRTSRKGERQRSEEPSGWDKTIGGLARPILRGVARLRFKLALRMTAYDLVWLPKLLLGATA
jgi:hypothetical protein